jgi:DNA-binding transcriptional LysR family regulator
LAASCFFRDKNRLYVTPKGRLFYQQAVDILTLADRSQQLFAGRQPQGLLNLGALDFFSDQSPAVTHRSLAPQPAPHAGQRAEPRLAGAGANAD